MSKSVKKLKRYYCVHLCISGNPDTEVFTFCSNFPHPFSLACLLMDDNGDCTLPENFITKCPISITLLPIQPC